ncbi:MAG: prephenate dehydrogenase dimerization domain-containing protein [Chloroflexota bacterium]
MRVIGIIGGGGAIGKVVTRYYERLGYEVLISDLGMPDSHSLDELLDRCRILYISVFPLEHIPPILDQIKARPNASDYVVLENGSIKELLSGPFHELDRAGVSLCATHPLCKADQPWKNQNVLLIPYGKRSADAVEVALDLYQEAEMNIHFIDSLEEHDELMCLLQLVPHLVLRVVSTVFAELGTDLQLLNSAATANFKLFYLSLWRVLVQSPDLSASIIDRLLHQPKGREIFDRLAATLTSLPLKDGERMADLFNSFYLKSSPSDIYRDRMNMQGIVTLERLANLERRSITIMTEQDRVGMLREILEPFDELGINLNAIDSHLLAGPKLRFDIGYDAGATKEQLMVLKERIEGMGHTFIMTSDE